jgi:hypothetical protein
MFPAVSDVFAFGEDYWAFLFLIQFISHLLRFYHPSQYLNVPLATSIEAAWKLLEWEPLRLTILCSS